MNILYGEPFSRKNVFSWSVHSYEVLSGLYRLGHNVVLLGGDSFVPSLASNSHRQSQGLSLWMRLGGKLGGFRIIRLFRGEMSIVWLILQNLWVFLLTLITIIRWKGRFNVIYRRHNLLISQYLLAKLFRIPLVTEVNGIIVDEIKLRKQGDKVSLLVIDKIERFNMLKTDKIIVVTSRLKEVLQEDYGVLRNKIVMIPNGANTNSFKPMDIIKVRKALGLSQRDYYVCWVGVMWQAQHVDCLINSVPLILKELPNTKFLIVGHGVMKQYLISLVEQLGVSDKVIFTGVVPYQKVPLYINASDVCVAPAARNFRNDRSGVSSLKLYEYMACGKPVIVDDIEGASQDVADSGSGFVVNTRNRDEMARAIITLLRNEQLRKEMGKRARKITVEKHSWAKIAERVAEVCRNDVK
jgi:glycosyltransferase involved in cell wall biosynthesis